MTEPGDEPQAGSITIRRRNLVQDVVRSYTVFIDNTPVGKMWAFQTKTFAVAPGRHEVQLKIINTGRSCSDVFLVMVKPGDHIVFRTHSRGVKNVLTLPLTMPAGVKALRRHERIDSRYYQWPWIRMAREDSSSSV
jgi:hypothetical protein